MLYYIVITKLSRFFQIPLHYNATMVTI